MISWGGNQEGREDEDDTEGAFGSLAWRRYPEQGIWYLSGHEGPGLRTAAANGHRVGFMAQPGNRNWARAEEYQVWAIDTGCYSARVGRQFDPLAYLRWLDRIPERLRDTCLCATAPDVPGA